MNWLRTYSIRARLLTCMALVVAIGMIIGTGTTLDLLRLRKGFEGLTQGELAAVMEMNRVAMAIAHLHAAERDIFAGPAAQMAELRRPWQTAAESAARAAQSVRERAASDPGTHQAIEAMQQRLKAYTQAMGAALLQLENGQSSVSTAQAARQDLRAAEQRLEQAAQTLQVAATQRHMEVSARIKRSIGMLWILLLSPGIIFLPLMWASIVSVVRPLRHAEQVVVAIAHGDLGQRIDIGGQDEIAHLLSAMNGMQAELNKMVDAVRHSSADMLTASTQIAAGNQDLSGRTEQTAVSLQQTTASIERLNHNVHESAQAARGANDLANQARNQAEHGGEVVAEVVANMEQISQASHKIGDITGVIDSIAFQTNILALNAAVEAARAGEQGRGFAVVASEVRSLAKRSAEAAREIKALIGASVERVDAGSQRVRDAGTAMQEIVAAIRRVTEAMAGIATATNEQSEGLSKVAQAVTSLDHMTQQNAALVQQSAAAADNLQSQASTLTNVVQRFRVDEHAHLQPH